MCDACTEILDLLQASEQRRSEEGGWLRKADVAIVCTYVQGWPQRQCMCCYKEAKHFEAFNNVVQGVLHIALEFLTQFSEDLQKNDKVAVATRDSGVCGGDSCQGAHNNEGGSPAPKKVDPASEETGDTKVEVVAEDEGNVEENTAMEVSVGEQQVEQVSVAAASEGTDMDLANEWTLDDKEKLLHFISKAFLLNFPPYVAYKHSVHSKLEEILPQEASALSIYCDINDPEIPVYLLRNVCFFCDRGGINAMTTAFQNASPETLPFSLAHAMIAVVSNLKLWMNIGSIVQCLVPLRTNVIRYMCKLSDKDLRVAGTRNMSEFMWTAVKDPLDAHLTFDKEGLDLAFKYFTSSTLTMRLAGIAQINNHINMYNELCSSETFMETENVGLGLANWLIHNKIIEHIFGPNLHVEVIKQSHVVLNFLAMEGRITNEHVDCMWAAAQLKHCSKPVHDLLPPLIKNLEAQPVLHLYCLLCKLEPKEHTEQTLYLASALIKYIWSNGGSPHPNLPMGDHVAPHSPFASMLKGSLNVGELEKVGLGSAAKHDVSSSERSVSVEASNSEEDEQSDTHPGPQNTSELDSSQLSDKRLSSNEGSEGCAEERLRRLHKAKHVCGSQRHQHRKHLVQRREPGEIGAMDDSTGSSEPLDSDLSNVSNDSLPSDEGESGRGLRVSGLSTLSESEEDSGHEDSPAEESIPRRKMFRHRQPPSRPLSHVVLHKHLETCPRQRNKHERTKTPDKGECHTVKVPRAVKPVLEAAEEDLNEKTKTCVPHISKDLCTEATPSNTVNKFSKEKDLTHEVSNDGLENTANESSAVSKVVEKRKVDCLVPSDKKSGDVSPGAEPKLKKNCGSPDSDTIAKVTIEAKDVLQSKEVAKEMVLAKSEKPADCAKEGGGESPGSELDVQEFNRMTEAIEAAEVYDCQEYLQQIHAQRHAMHENSDMIEDILSPDDGSCSSRNSNKSEKNMADFDGEESGCEDELVQLAAHTQSHLSSHHMQQHFATMASMYRSHLHHAKAFHRCTGQKEGGQAVGQFEIDLVCKPGHTLLWDLLQDDTVGLLGEGLASEAEKVLCSLVCWSPDRHIRMKFIEGCLENLANNRSVVVSLRLLPKLFASFAQYRGGMDTHTVALWAERDHKMMKHFFNNLVTYTNSVSSRKSSSSAMYSHQIEIQVRLQFLTCVYSSMGSPDNFRLTLEQVDTLWSCLATDRECSDELFSWLLNQAKNKDQHAMGLESFKHIFIEKMPSLPPETTSMTALNLYQQLSSLTRLAAAASDVLKESEASSGMDQLWGIALRAENTDVSMAAIQFLNSYYINIHHGTLEKEDEFIQRCTSSLSAAASEDLDQAEESNLIIIQRGLLLLKTHLETFQRRYAYHLRLWHLDGCGIISHQRSLAEKQSATLHVICQPGGLSDKVTFELLGSDYIADLRAEVTRWWDQFQQRQRQNKKRQEGELKSSGNDVGSNIPNLLDGPIRMISQGQELTADLDERTLQEMGFKDNQLVFVSVGAARPQRKREGLEPTSQLPCPPRNKLPMVLLLQPPHFEQLFSLMHQLSSIRTTRHPSEWAPHVKGQLLSHRVWELLMMLPTSPAILESFKNLTSKDREDQSVLTTLQTVLNPESPQKLMYSLQIVESLSKPSRARKLGGSGGNGDCRKENREPSQELGGVNWTKEFIEHGGLRHLFDIFMSGALQSGDSEVWNEWNQDCLAYLLMLINEFGMESIHSTTKSEESLDSFEAPRKKAKRNRRGSSDKLIIPRLNQTMLSMMDVGPVTEVLMNVLQEAAMIRDGSHYQTGFWGRAQVVHYAITILVHWSYSSEAVKPALFSSPNLPKLLKQLLLDDAEPAVRREACTGQYRLCLGTTADGKTGQGFIAPLLSCLLSFLPDAQTMKSLRMECEEDGKEPYGPACRDYFWLVCRLVDNLDEDIIKEFNEDSSQTLPLDLDSMVRYLAKAILSRDYMETRHSVVEDEGLIGLITLCTAIIKHNPPFKYSKEGQDFLLQVFECLFALPSPQQRFLPKCKSTTARSAAYDLLVEMVKGCVENYKILHRCLLQQHSPNSHAPYPWDYWPHEDGRSDCGYVGLTNLGATCYMASCMQHLYMMPQARSSILMAKQCNSDTKHESTLHELQRMFAYLLESERKAYNPKSFCKVYMMDHQPLNTGEQKDMAEFFTDLISKLEEMTPQLKELVKTLFCGVITNNVVSLDCPHVSRTLEEFYTVRCQVADLRNLYESLDEVTVKDTLEGDNMYTCSQCGKKVRAEKRACFKKLPKIICFNTMRYTFNMVTMLKEKVNTHFSFPLRLDMSGYTEQHLMPDQHKVEEDAIDDDSFLYDLIGVTVHTGTADGGHYYSFIRDRTAPNKDKWFLFNDAEVKPFDPAQIAAECFGGEMTSKTYDSVTDKFMDFSFEKTNSAYMLFYERYTPEPGEVKDEVKPSRTLDPASDLPAFELTKDLADWIWQDNMQFLQDKNILEHVYFNFMWQICGYIPQTMAQHDDVTLMSAKLSTSFVLETLIHAKEKPTMVQWIELLTKQFNASQSACEWFLDHMAENDWWPVQILIKCPNQVVRQMFQRLCIHVINKLKPVQLSYYVQPYVDSDDSSDVDISQVGRFSCVTRFIRKLLTLIEHGAKQHCKHLTEYFTFLLEFAKMGEEESQFLIATEAVSVMVNFYLGQKSSEYVDVVSDEDDDEDDDVISIVDDKYKPASLEKMITLIATLVEKSRGDDHRLHLSQNDFNAVAGGKAFPFLFQQVRDNINIRQTCNLIFSLCRWNDRLALHIVTMIFQAITKHHELNQPFFKLLTMLVEFAGGPPGLPSFTNLVLQRIWEVAEYCPQQCLEWLSMQMPRNKIAHTWVLQNMESWVEHFLIAHTNQRVRNAAAYLLVSLVPSNHFRQAFRTARSVLSPQKEIPMNPEVLMILHQIYDLLLRLLKRARHYVDPPTHGTTKLMSYFALMTYCLISRTEKLMFGQYFLDLWQLFQPKLSEPPIAVHHNKQALLIFWYQACVDCHENVKLIVQNGHVTKNIAFNYILADHDDQDVMIFNRCMLPAYYGLLRLCCQQSRAFTRQLASHQNIQWAFKNITPYTTQYAAAIDELFKLMRLFVMKYPDSSEQEQKEIHSFKRTTLQLYLGILDARSCWATLITACRILLETNEDRLFLVYNNGLPMMFEAFHTLHVMYHEATACHVTGDLVDLLSIILEVLKCTRMYRDTKEVKQCLYIWKERMDSARKLVTLLNSYTPQDVRHICIDVLRELLLLYPGEILQTLVPMLTHCHATFQENNVAGRAFKEIASGYFTFGPFFPKQGQKSTSSKSNLRPQRPMFQMFLHPSQIEVPKGVDEEYDGALLEFFFPYHQFVDILCRMAINHDAMTEGLVSLSAMVGYEGIPLHLALFPKLWMDIYQAEHVDKKYVDMLCLSNYLVDYLEGVLLDERTSLNNPTIFQFCGIFFPKVSQLVMNDQVRQQMSSLMSSVPLNLESKDLRQMAYKINGELRVLCVVLTSDNLAVDPEFMNGLKTLQQCCDSCETLPKPSAEEEMIEADELDSEIPSKRQRLSESADSPEATGSQTAMIITSSTTCTTSSSSSSMSTMTSEESPQEGTSKSLPIPLAPKPELPNWVELLSKTIGQLLVQLSATPDPTS